MMKNQMLKQLRNVPRIPRIVHLTAAIWGLFIMCIVSNPSQRQISATYNDRQTVPVLVTGQGEPTLYLPVILWTVPTETEPNDHYDIANPIEPGKTYYGRFPDPLDVNDYYYFDLTAPALVEIRLTSIPVGHDYTLVLRDINLDPPISFSSNPNNEDEIIVVNSPLYPGRYYIQVYNQSMSGTNRYYNLQLILDDVLIIADFLSCNSTNNFGGLMGAGCPVSGCPAPNSMTVNYEMSGTGCEVRLDYQIQDWSAFWLMLNHADMVAYTSLSFDVKGSGGIVNPGRTMKIEIKRDCQFVGTGSVCQEISIFNLGGITSNWQRQRPVYFSQFVGTGWPGFAPISDWSDIEELVFTFEAGNSGTSGTVYLDNILLR